MGFQESGSSGNCFDRPDAATKEITLNITVPKGHREPMFRQSSFV
jgi:hypothetical protein